MSIPRPQSKLPIDAVLPEIVASLRRNHNLVIEAAPGAGKTTRVPPALLEIVRGEVIVLEPRRIAARLAARRVAFEMGEQAGETVGYQVRFEEVTGPRTRLRFVTEGVLTRRFVSDPELRGVDAVVLDEFHERHLDGDFALALLKRLQVKRPELRIVVMSATLEAAPLSEYLNACPVVRSAGRQFELAIQHVPYSPRPLEMQVRDALAGLLRANTGGHVLAFLPGAAEIRRAMRECQSVASAAGAALLPLHGDLGPADQDRAVAPSSQQKIILSTNVAESSVTIDGVNAVIDSGLARFASYSPWSGLPTLQVGRISKASAMQRAGRAGRTAAGVAVRLYSPEDFAQRPDRDTPEILRSDLSGLCLGSRAMGFSDLLELEWLDTPAPAAIDHAEALLDRLGASGNRARSLARYPLPPRLSRMLVESLERGVAEDGIAAAALLGSGARCERNDLLSALDLPTEARTLQQRQQLRRIAREPRQIAHNEDALLLSVLAGFPDRVARLKQGKQIMISTGVSAELTGEPPPYEFMVVVDAEDRKEKQMPLARMTARIEPEWLIDLFPERLKEEITLEWNAAQERVDAVSTLRYDELVIEQSVSKPGPAAAAELLAQKALEAGLGLFVDSNMLEETLARIQFAGLSELDLGHELRSLSAGLRSFRELKDAARSLPALLEAAAGVQKLRELAPANIELSSGRKTRIHYERGKPPWIASRLQDFFGMQQTPRIGRDKVPLVVHLLAPNQRAVQTTSDLEGFWRRLYPEIRRQLMRRYPRHAWPEDPSTPVRG